MKKHVGVLEQAGLVTTEKVGRVRTCRLGQHSFEEEAAWIEVRRRLWDARFPDALDQVVEGLKRKEKTMNSPAQPSNGPSERELVVTRTINGPARMVFEAWTKPELFMRWWAPASFGMTFLSCETDVRTGGSYRSCLGHPAAEQPMAFFGRYIEVIPGARIVWTNEEGDDGAVTTATFEEKDGKTLVVVHDLYPRRSAWTTPSPPKAQALRPEQFEALDELLATLGAGA